MPVLTDTFALSNGVEIPKVGFGTWQIPDGPLTYDSVRTALDTGYRHIDTARAYGNEASVGRAVRDSGLPREDVFITTKCPAEVKDAAGARHAAHWPLRCRRRQLHRHRTELCRPRRRIRAAGA